MVEVLWLYWFHRERIQCFLILYVFLDLEGVGEQVYFFLIWGKYFFWVLFEGFQIEDILFSNVSLVA